jgi:hypothetical protein
MPAVLLHIDLHHMAAQIVRTAGGGRGSGRSRIFFQCRATAVNQEVYLHHLKSTATPLAPTFSSGYPVQRLQADGAQQQLGA